MKNKTNIHDVKVKIHFEVPFELNSLYIAKQLREWNVDCDILTGRHSYTLVIEATFAEASNVIGLLKEAIDMLSIS